jgi:hypothetical protein
VPIRRRISLKVSSCAKSKDPCTISRPQKRQGILLLQPQLFGGRVPSNHWPVPTWLAWLQLLRMRFEPLYAHS